jgi:cell division protein FtsW (lipid II flippase)
VSGRGHVDYVLLGAVLVLLALGIQMVYSASVYTARLRYHDWEYFLRVTKGWRGYLLAAPLGVYRVHAGSLTVTGTLVGAALALVLLVVSGPLAVTLWRRRTAPAVHDPPDTHDPPGGQPSGPPVTSDLRTDR